MAGKRAKALPAIILLMPGIEIYEKVIFFITPFEYDVLYAQCSGRSSKRYFI